MSKFKDFLKESFSKEYAYRIKIAADCSNDHLDVLEACLQKYNLVSAAAWKRTPIQENPTEFVRAKGIKCISEVCSTDVVIKYPTNERILEVWLAVNMGIDPDRIIVQGIKEARRGSADLAAARVVNDKDRSVSEEDAVLLNGENQEHDYYTEAVGELDDGPWFGEEYNKKFLDELARIKKEKGADYFRNYPTKDDMMGDTLRTTWDELHNGSNMGQGHESDKAVSVNNQNLGKK
jgi:hypothetical protein